MEIIRKIELAGEVWTLIRQADGYVIEYGWRNEEPICLPVTPMIIDLMAADIRAEQTPIPDYRQNIIQLRRLA